jgi:hypothetical protein
VDDHGYVEMSEVHLDADHRDALYRAVKATLASNIAEITMAQLVDGLPRTDIAWEARGNFLIRGHPIEDHEQLCKGVLETT